MRADKEIRECELARRMQEALGEGYVVRYDDCESGMTRFYYNGYMYKQIRDGEMTMNICEYRAPIEVLMGYVR